MKEETRKVLIARFINDEMLAEAVRVSILNTYLIRREGDIHLKAGQRIAIDLLLEAWSELGREGTVSHKEKSTAEQIGI